MELDLNKIIRSLDLTKSDARDKTIEGIVEYILYSVNDHTDLNGLREFVKVELSLELFIEDLTDCINSLIELGYVKLENQKYCLTPERNAEIRQLDIANTIAKEKRFDQFKEFIAVLEPGLIFEDVQLLWKIVTEYIYECFLQHGKIALEFFNSSKEGIKDTSVDLNSLIKKHADQLPNNKLANIFKHYIQSFSEIITPETLEYLVNLSYKTEAFFALGLSKEEYDLVYKDILFDWTVLVDTNFLYSILDLHSHTDNSVAKALLEVGTGLNISFKYLPMTLKELEVKSKDFDTIIPKNLNISQITALVKSEKLDNFTQRYFEKKLEDMDNTPHPSDVVGHAQNNLKTRKLEIYRSNFDSLSSQVEYLRIQESKYSQYLATLDELRVERGLRMKGIKDVNQVAHDIFLREAVLQLRSSKINSITDVKYFGVTEDKTLLKFDSVETARKRDSLNIPVFFSPSSLLRRLLKYSPVQSDDYKRAFISTISSPALENNTAVSKIAIRSVKYFHNMGISDDRMILNCIKDEIFLYKFRDKEAKQEDLDEFVESEIQRQYSSLNKKYEETEAALQNKTQAIDNLQTNLLETSHVNDSLQDQLKSTAEMLKVYEKMIKKIKKQPTVNQIVYQQLTLEDEKKAIESQIPNTLVQENLTLKERLLHKDYDDKYKQWQLKSLWLMGIILPVLLQIPLLLFWQTENWNWLAILIEDFSMETSLKQGIFQLISVGIFGLFVTIPARVIYRRFYSYELKNAFLTDLQNRQKL